jgi:hypothetical protein
MTGVMLRSEKSAASASAWCNDATHQPGSVASLELGEREVGCCGLDRQEHAITMVTPAAE